MFRIRFRRLDEKSISVTLQSPDIDVKFLIDEFKKFFCRLFLYFNPTRLCEEFSVRFFKIRCFLNVKILINNFLNYFSLEIFSAFPYPDQLDFADFALVFFGIFKSRSRSTGFRDFRDFSI